MEALCAALRKVCKIITDEGKEHFLTSTCWVGVGCMPLSPEFERHTQEDLYGYKASLVHIMSSRPVNAAKWGYFLFVCF